MENSANTGGRGGGDSLQMLHCNRDAALNILPMFHGSDSLCMYLGQPVMKRFFLFSVQISVVEPLGGILGEPASIFCQSHATNVNPNAFVLRDADDLTVIYSNRFRLGLLNATHVEFILSEVQMSDNGTRFVCGFHEFNSFPATFTASCK